MNSQSLGAQPGKIKCLRKLPELLERSAYSDRLFRILRLLLVARWNLFPWSAPIPPISEAKPLRTSSKKSRSNSIQARKAAIHLSKWKIKAMMRYEWWKVTNPCALMMQKCRDRVHYALSLSSSSSPSTIPVQPSAKVRIHAVCLPVAIIEIEHLLASRLERIEAQQ